MSAGGFFPLLPIRYGYVYMEEAVVARACAKRKGIPRKREQLGWVCKVWAVGSKVLERKGGKGALRTKEMLRKTKGIPTTFACLVIGIVLRRAERPPCRPSAVNASNLLMESMRVLLAAPHADFGTRKLIDSRLQRGFFL